MKLQSWLVLSPLLLAGCGGPPHESQAETAQNSIIEKPGKGFPWGPPAPEAPVLPVTNPDFPEQPNAPLNPGNTGGLKQEDKIVPSTGAAQVVPH